jgi:predicted nucleic acid-binding Zn ribbon protein
MPTYLFRCPICHEEKTEDHSITDIKRPVCDHAGGLEPMVGDVEMEIVIQPSMFVLKGSGWANDGYGSKR